MVTITAEQVSKFAVRSRRIKLLTDAQKAAREEILIALKKGASIPLDGPYVIDLSQNGGKDFSWEDEYRALRISQLKADDYTQKEAEALVAQEMKEKKDAAPDKDSEVVNGESYVGGVKLTPKVNANYGRKKVAA
jgi:hypothetical protein